jgi:hypothetical protein
MLEIAPRSANEEELLSKFPGTKKPGLAVRDRALREQ